MMNICGESDTCKKNLRLESSKMRGLFYIDFLNKKFFSVGCVLYNRPVFIFIGVNKILVERIDFELKNSE